MSHFCPRFRRGERPWWPRWSPRPRGWGLLTQLSCLMNGWILLVIMTHCGIDPWSNMGFDTVLGDGVGHMVWYGYDSLLSNHIKPHEASWNKCWTMIRFYLHCSGLDLSGDYPLSTISSHYYWPWLSMINHHCPLLSIIIRQYCSILRYNCQTTIYYPKPLYIPLLGTWLTTITTVRT